MTISRGLDDPYISPQNGSYHVQTILALFDLFLPFEDDHNQRYDNDDVDIDKDDDISEAENENSCLVALKIALTRGSMAMAALRP